MLQVLTEQNIELVYAFEKASLKAQGLSEIEASFVEWESSWRKESLEHYLKLGWSLGVYEDDRCEKLLGYYLAQPLLFYNNQTQTLWLERINYLNQDVAEKLIDTAYRQSREKHLQKLILSSKSYDNPEFRKFPWFAGLGDKVKVMQESGQIEVLTAKIKDF